MSIQLSSFINRLPKTTQQPKMTKTASSIKQREYNQYGAMNTNALNGNELETNIEMVGIHLYSAGSIMMLIFIVFLMILCWRCCKKKNRKKIARFICVCKCKYAEDEEDGPETTKACKKTGQRVEEIPLDVNRLVDLSNQLAMNNAFAQVHSQSRSVSTNNLSTVATVEAPTNI